MLKQLLLSKNKPHSIIFVESRFCHLEKVIEDFFCSMLTNKHDIERLKNNQYFDYISFNGYIENMKKENIIEIQNKFSLTSFEKDNLKFYTIFGIETTNKQSLNSLLKFLEEPQDNAYGILTTRNIAKVIPTITSRCQVIYLPTDLTYFQNEIKKYQLNNEQVKLIYQTYYNFSEFEKEFENGFFNTCTNFVQSLIINHSNLAKLKGLSAEFRSFDYLQIKRILCFIKVLVKDEKGIILNLINQLNLNPIKALIFNEILSLWNI